MTNSFPANDYLDCAGIGSGEGIGGMLTAEEMSKQQEQLVSTVDAIIPRLSDITRLLLKPPQKPELKTTVGSLNPPFGVTRLSVVKLICALLSTNIFAINVQLMNLKTIDILLDLFFKYSLNNFLHAQVEQCINLLFSWTPQQPLPDIPCSNDAMSEATPNQTESNLEHTTKPDPMAVEDKDKSEKDGKSEMPELLDSQQESSNTTDNDKQSHSTHNINAEEAIKKEEAMEEEGISIKTEGDTIKVENMEEEPVKTEESDNAIKTAESTEGLCTKDLKVEETTGKGNVTLYFVVF